MTHIFGRRWWQLRNFLHKNLPNFSAPNVTCMSFPKAYLSPISDPGQHKINDIGFYYIINDSHFLDVLTNRKMGSDYVEECKTFQETAFMVRRPSLEVIHYLKNANYSHPINKYVLYGKYGNGVTFALLQIIYYAYLSGWLIVDLPWVLSWSLKKTEVIKSTKMGGDFVDLPVFGSSWLSYFKHQNINILNTADLKLHDTYVWNVQEKNEKGDDLLDLVNFGISRPKYSCEVINLLLEELKEFSREEKIRTLAVIDGYSSLFKPFRQCQNKKIKHVPPYHISCMQGFKNLAKADWHNGAAVLTCYSDPENTDVTGYLPMSQLTTQGFEFLDPFVPVFVPSLTDREMISLLTYYRSHKWLHRTDGDEEMKFLSNGNFLTLKRLCGHIW